MATSAVNPIPILATPPVGSARSLVVPDGFVDTLNKALRREDAPVARRERPQQAESDSPAKKPHGQTNAVTDTSVEQEPSSSDRGAATTERVDKGSPERTSEDERESTDSTSDVVVISDQAIQQSAAVVQVVIPEGETGVGESVDNGATSIATDQQNNEPATSGPPSTPTEIPPTAPAVLDLEASTAGSGKEVSEASLEAEAVQVLDPQKSTTKNADAAAAAAKLQVNTEPSSDVETQDGEPVAKNLADGSSVPQDSPPIAAVQTAEGDAGRDSGSAKHQASAKVEPKSTLEEQPQTPETEAEGLKLHAEGDSARSESKDRPALSSTNFTSVLDRATSLASRRSTPTEQPSQQSPQVDAQRFVNRVSRAFQVAEHRGGPLQIRLSPPELGAMKIELTIQQGTLTAKLETETAAAKSVLLDNLPALRERLAAQEIRIDKFEVDVRQENSGEQPNWQAQQEGQDARHARAATTGGRLTTQQITEVPGAGQPTASRSHHDGQFSAVA